MLIRVSNFDRFPSNLVFLVGLLLFGFLKKLDDELNKCCCLWLWKPSWYRNMFFLFAALCGCVGLLWQCGIFRCVFPIEIWISDLDVSSVFQIEILIFHIWIQFSKCWIFDLNLISQMEMMNVQTWFLFFQIGMSNSGSWNWEFGSGHSLISRWKLRSTELYNPFVGSKFQVSKFGNANPPVEVCFLSPRRYNNDAECSPVAIVVFNSWMFGSTILKFDPLDGAVLQTSYMINGNRQKIVFVDVCAYNTVISCQENNKNIILRYQAKNMSLWWFPYVSLRYHKQRHYLCCFPFIKSRYYNIQNAIFLLNSFYHITVPEAKHYREIIAKQSFGFGAVKW